MGYSQDDGKERPCCLLLFWGVSKGLLSTGRVCWSDLNESVGVIVPRVCGSESRLHSIRLRRPWGDSREMSLDCGLDGCVCVWRGVDSETRVVVHMTLGTTMLSSPICRILTHRDNIH